MSGVHSTLWLEDIKQNSSSEYFSHTCACWKVKETPGLRNPTNWKILVRVEWFQIEPSNVTLAYYSGQSCKHIIRPYLLISLLF